MAILKQALFSLAILASSASTQAGEETKQQVSLEQILKTTDEAVKKVAAGKDWLQDKEKDEKFEPWLVLETRFGASGELHYRLPQGFNLGLDGTVKGYGFSWRFGDRDFYYRDTPVLGSLSLLYGADFKKEITIGGKTLEELEGFYPKDGNIAGTIWEDAFTQLQRGLEEFYNGKTLEDLPADDALKQLGEDLEDKTKDNKLTLKEGLQLLESLKETIGDLYSNEEKQGLEDIMGNFKDSIDKVLKENGLDEVINQLRQDPQGSITLFGSTIKDINTWLERLLLDIAGFMDVQIGKDRFRIKGMVSGEGEAHAEWATTYKLKKGNELGEFTQVIAMDEAMQGSFHADIDLRLAEGAPLYTYLTDETLKLILENLDDTEWLNTKLKDASLDAIMGYEGHTKRIFTESFQLAKYLSNGKRGVGTILGIGRETSNIGRAEIHAKLDTWEKTFTGTATAEQTLERYWNTKTLLYIFDEGEFANFWHYGMIGTEYFDNKSYNYQKKAQLSFDMKWQDRAAVDYEMTSQREQNSSTGTRSVVNMAAGLKGKLVNPFMSYMTFPDETFKIGMLLDIPHFATRFSARTTASENSFSYNSMQGQESITVETALTFFDEKGNAKTMDYYIRTEQFDASPILGKTIGNRNAMTEYYSDLNGLLLTTKIADNNYRVRGLWGTDSTFFFGVGYFGNFKEKLLGEELIVGYDKFSVVGGIGAATEEKKHSEAFNLSAAGLFNGNTIYLDVHKLIGPLAKERDYEIPSRGYPIVATLNIAGLFDETNLLERITRDVIETLNRQKKDH